MEGILNWIKAQDKLEQGLYGCWLIWNNRNNCLHNLTCTVSARIKDMSARMENDFEEALVRLDLQVQDRRRHWTPPPTDKYKINVDAGFSYSLRTISLGVVVRDMNAKVCLSVVTKLKGIYLPLQAELNAILFGLRVVQDLNIKELLVETDSLIAVNEILKKEGFFCEWESIIVDIWDLSIKFSSCFFFHISRSINVLAHSIAKVSYGIGEHKIWENSLFVIQILLLRNEVFLFMIKTKKL